MADTFKTPKDVTRADMAFGSRMADLLPAMTLIPEDFRNERGTEARKWIGVQRKWFFEGVRRDDFVPRDGVDADKALAHIQAIQGSFEPKHEHKQAAVAWLMSRWFSDFKGEVHS